MSRLLLLFGFLLMSAPLAQAQQMQQGFPSPFDFQGTPEDQAACRGDATKLCREYLSQGNMVVLQCFQANRPRLSRSCEAVLRKYGQ